MPNRDTQFQARHLRRASTLVGCVLILAVALTAANAGHDSPRTAAPASSVDPPPSGLRELWVWRDAGLKPNAQTMLATLEGVANQHGARIWQYSHGISEVIEGQLAREGVVLHRVSDPWSLVDQFRPDIKGVVLYQGTETVNAATSVCGILQAIAVDPSLLAKAQERGLPILADVRGETDETIFAKYGEYFDKQIVVEQVPSQVFRLRDFAVARHAFTYWGRPREFRAAVFKFLSPHVKVYGWGRDEYEWVKNVSAVGGSVVAADWCNNLSALQWLPAGPLIAPTQPAVHARPNTRYVAFVMTDGDNLQWLTGSFVDQGWYWASPLRGRFPMTWELSPDLAITAPRTLQYLYSTATPNDAFVGGAGVPGYQYAHFQPNFRTLADEGVMEMRASGLDLASVINDNDGTMGEIVPLVQEPGIKAVLYKTYAPYHGKDGAIRWDRGKPIMSFKYSLWVGLMSPDDISREVAKMPASPFTDERSFALVSVHAWYDDPAGPMEAVRKTISLLPPNTQVVTAPQLVGMVIENFAARHGGSGQ